PRRVLLTAAHVFSFLSQRVPSPSFPSVATGHRRALTRSAGRERAMRQAPGAAPVSVDRGAAALQFVIPRTQPLAALAGAWRRTAATVEARARSRPRSAQTRAAGSRWPVCWAPRRWQTMIPRQTYSRAFIFPSSHTLRTRSRHAFRAARERRVARQRLGRMEDDAAGL